MKGSFLENKSILLPLGKHNSQSVRPEFLSVPKFPTGLIFSFHVDWEVLNVYLYGFQRELRSKLILSRLIIAVT